MRIPDGGNRLCALRKRGKRLEHSVDAVADAQERIAEDDEIRVVGNITARSS
ncbi:hypothetical protein SDC9_202724 [bioreactor metagenome]|uniref:Uncharacterized protein n=1 Tax=bioreactor metagenome TaxID=1076179 RepID=A0A645IUF0_9ZZZZ